MRTTLGICTRKRRYPAEADAILAAIRAGVTLRPYRCELCRRYHLTSRTKGKRVLRHPSVNSRSDLPNDRP